MLNDYDFHKLLDDLKRISRLVPILRFEKDELQRERVATVMLDELQKLTDDLEEIKKERETGERDE